MGAEEIIAVCNIGDNVRAEEIIAVCSVGDNVRVEKSCCV